MQTTTLEVNKLLKEGLAVKALPQLIAEWNMNRYAGIQTVDSTPTEYDEGDPEYYPIESIADPLRPSSRGIVKARASVEGIVSEYTDRPGDKRYYLADYDDPYKYWSSPVASSLIGGLNGFSKTVRPYIIYKTASWTNKLYFLFENSAAWPVDYDIDITTDGTNWTTVGGDIIPDSKGRVVLYRQANGTWGTAVYRDNPVKLKGIRLKVNTLSSVGKYLELIEMSCRLEQDLTATLMTSSSQFNMGTTSFITPLGSASSNTASIQLSNIDGRYNNTNDESLFYGLVDKNIKFTYRIGYDTTPVGGSGMVYVTEYTMFADSWAGQGEEIATVSLKDASKFLQEIKPPKMFFENMTLGRIVWQLCDIIGFSDYFYDKTDDDKATIVPYFWTDGEKTIWEIFSSLASTTQSAIYFDEFGILQILTRDKAYNIGNPIAWQLDGVVNGTKQPDIVDVAQSYDFEANNVTVRYQATSISDVQGRTPVMDIAWQPEGDVVLRSSQLRESMDATQMFIRMTGSEASVWPYSGIIECEGELMRYDAKGYWYYNKSGVATFKAITSADEKKQIDEELSSPELAFKNYFSGWFRIAERGLWNTYPAAHKDDASGYGVKVANYKGDYKTWTGGFVHNKDQSTISLKATTSTNVNTCYVASRGSETDKSIWYVGTRLRFRDTGYNHGMAGIAFNLGSKDKGYYMEICRTDRLPGGRKYQNEINFYIRRSNGKLERFGPSSGKGVAMAISKNIWYDIDIAIRMENGVYGDPGAFVGHVIQVSINGNSVMTFTIPVSKKEPLTGRFGVFTRGSTHADFEYLYGNGTTEDLHIDTTDMFDRIRGGIVSSQADSEWIYKWHYTSHIVKKKKKYLWARYAQRFFDDFGPICHELREYDVQFDKFPAVHSNIYFSNDTQVVCPEYNANPFGAKFILANAYRNNAIVNGEDTLTFGADNPVEQKLMIYGRTVNKEDEKTIVSKNDDAIRRRGSVETEVSSDWIQTESAAQALADWITYHWADGCDEVEAEIFGNPLIQLGDIVSINYPQKDFDPVHHRYFVVELNRGYDTGYDTTKLTLRRVKA
ncbi:minor tail protein [Streptomyces phage Daubenski]|uniref:Minor tail protein n=1 Tax=Streptomyces phage Daubenski TaxID=2653725 RepID=A0A5Q2WG48_9CAUD|nr:minor tail protein [Streptomyces phage Daubenski]QGH76370.1 minor tail protein [Streptomyces phage Daubenski]